MDGAILVTSATKGVSQLTRDYYEHLKHASSLKNQDTLLPFINYDCPEEEREELTELITEELKEFMTPKEMSHLVTGSAKDEHVVKAIADRVTELFSFEEMSEKRNQTKVLFYCFAIVLGLMKSAEGM
jgi:translation elongation factor EF-Tu-like GTPase